MGFEAQYELFLESVTCTALERVLDHHVISGAAIPLPGFGMNGKIAYPADEPSWVDDMQTNSGNRESRNWSSAPAG